VVSVPEKLFCT